MKPTVDELKAAVRASGETYGAISKRAGISQPYLSQIMSGARQGTPDTRRRVMSVLANPELTYEHRDRPQDIGGHVGGRARGTTGTPTPQARAHRRQPRAQLSFEEPDRATVAWIAQQKDVPCVDCGKRYHLVAMDFDHVRGDKLFNVSQAAGRPIDEVKAEIAKCDVRCCNCHRTRHALDGGRIL